MVFFVTLSDPTALCYQGKHKEENELLIEWGFPQDVWFHVDKLSSAHVYLRQANAESGDLDSDAIGDLARGQRLLDGIPDAVLQDCLQLVKQNSIEGSKKPVVSVVYTPWFNLKKTSSMAPGEVGFHDEKLVRRVHNVKKDRTALLRMKKTVREVWPTPDLQKLREDRDREVAAKRKAQADAKRAADAAAEKALLEDKASRSYDLIHTASAMKSNKEAAYDDDDFFM